MSSSNTTNTSTIDKLKSWASTLGFTAAVVTTIKVVGHVPPRSADIIIIIGSLYASLFHLLVGANDTNGFTVSGSARSLAIPVMAVATDYTINKLFNL